MPCYPKPDTARGKHYRQRTRRAPTEKGSLRGTRSARTGKLSGAYGSTTADRKAPPCLPEALANVANQTAGPLAPTANRRDGATTRFLSVFRGHWAATSTAHKPAPLLDSPLTMLAVCLDRKVLPDRGAIAGSAEPEPSLFTKISGAACCMTSRQPAPLLGLMQNVIQPERGHMLTNADIPPPKKT